HGLEHVQDVDGVGVGVQHVLQLAVHGRGFVGPAAPQLHAQALQLAVHFVHVDLAADANPPAPHPLPAAGGPGAAHDAAGAVHRAVEGFAGPLAVFAADDDGDVAHAAAHEAELPGVRRRGAFADDDELFAAVLFLPGEVVVVVHLEVGLRAQDAEHLVHDDVPPGVGVGAGQLHGLVVRATQLAVHAQQHRRHVHGLARVPGVERPAGGQVQKAGGGLVAEAAGAEVNGHPQVAGLDVFH